DAILQERKDGGVFEVYDFNVSFVCDVSLDIKEPCIILFKGYDTDFQTCFVGIKKAIFSCLKAGPSPQKPAPPPSVLLATAVQAFRFVNGQYTKQGKVGAAILGNHPTREYMILLYGSQQKPITTAKIHLGFIFTVQPGNYGTFYDDQRLNWSLMFDSEKAGLCVARWNSEAAVDSLLTQDLLLGEGQAVDYGDMVEVAFTGWLLQNHNIGQKSGRRLHIVPPTLGYGSKGIPNRVPSSSTLVYNVEIRRVKFAKDSGSERQSGGLITNSPSLSVDSLGFVMSPQSQPPTSISAEPGGQPLHVKSNSINEQLMQPDAAKAKLISRMAKMGQPMLPFLTRAIPAQPDHSLSETEDPSESHPSHHCPHPQPVQMSAVHAVPGVAVPTAGQKPVFMETVVPQAVDCGGSSHVFQPSFQSEFGPSCLGQFHPHHAVSYQAPIDVTSFLMTEARQHNTEIGQAVGKVADKINLLVSKENLFLKKEVLEKSTRVEEQNWKIGELLEQNQRNDALKSNTQQNQPSLLQAEQDKVHLTEYLASSSTLVSKLQSSSLQRSVSDLQTQLSQALQDRESHCTQISSLERLVEEEELQDLRAEKGNLDTGGYEKEQHSHELAEITQQRDILARTLTQLQEQYMAAQSRAETTRKQLEIILVEQETRHAQQPNQDAVKRVMNGVFHSLRGEFGLHQSYQGSDVLGVMLSTIKSVTLDLLTAHDREEEEEEKWTKAVEQNGRRVNDDEEINRSSRSTQEKEDSGVTQTAWTSIVRSLWSEAQVEEESINSEGLQNEAEDTSREETPSKAWTDSENGLTPSSLMVLIEEMSCQAQPLTVQIDQSKQMEVAPPF
ncbi:unnamed protein product, partial [Coregonus sp. 'balchen']